MATYGYGVADQRILCTETAGAKTGLILYDEAGRWLADYDSAGKVTRQAVWLDDYLIGLVDNGKLLYVEPDHVGSPRAVIDPVSKAVLWRWRPSNDPFGASLPDEDAHGDGIPFVFDLRFPGQRYDSVTGLYYNYIRDYDATSGRYIQVDPIGLTGGINPYLYVNGSPMKYTDPTGEVGIVGAIAGVVIELGFQAAGNYWRGCAVLNPRNYDWIDVGLSAAFGAVSPGWFTVGKTSMSSGRAISTLTGQMRRSRTPTRVAKLERRITSHEKKIYEVVAPQLKFSAAKSVGKAFLNSNATTGCGC